MPVITVPGKGTIEFPDSMSDEDISLAIRRDILKEPEASKFGAVENIARGIGERASQLSGSLLRGIATAVDKPADILDRASASLGIPSIVEYDEKGIRLRRATEADIATTGGAADAKGRDTVMDLARSAEGLKLGYTPGTTWEQVKKSPLSSFLPFALEQGLVSAPDMAAAMATLPAYVAARTGEIGQTRATNDARKDATVADLMGALPAAAGSALLERIGTKGILGIDEAVAQGVKGVLKETGKAGLKEGATEAGQELIEGLGESVGTKKGVDLAEIGDRMLAGAVGGAGFGAPVRAVGASVQALRGDQAPVPAPEAPVTSDAPSLRTVMIGMTPPRETWEVDEGGKEIEPPPVPTSIEILSEPNEGGLQTVRFPDGRVVEVPASEIAGRLIPEAAPVEAAPTIGVEAPVAEAEPTISAGPGITDVTDVTDVTEPVAPVLEAAPVKAAPAEQGVLEPVAAVEPAPEVVPEVVPEVTPAVAPEVAPAPEVTPAVELAPEVTPVAAVEPTLPIGLSRATPNFNFGPNRFNLAFSNDRDKAVYIATSKTPSKARPKYIAWLNSQGLSNPTEIEAIGAQIRADIKNNIRAGANPSEPLRLQAYSIPAPAPVTKIPEVEVAAPTPAPAPPPAMAAPAMAAPVLPTPAPAPPPAMAAPAGPEPAPAMAAPVPAPESAPESEPQVFTPELAEELGAYNPELSKTLKGKTLAQAVRYVTENSKSDFYKQLGNRVSGMVDALSNAGMKFTFSVSGEPGGFSPQAHPRMQIKMRNPDVGGVTGLISDPTFGEDVGYNQTDVVVRGKPLPSAPDRGANETTLLHEALHAVTSATLRMGAAGNLPKGSRAEKASNEMIDLFIEVRGAKDALIKQGGEIGKIIAYLNQTNAFLNERELVSWGLTNYNMQTLLRAIPVKGSDNAFTKFVSLIGKMLGFNEKDSNALRRLVEISEDLIPTKAAARREIAALVTMPRDRQAARGVLNKYAGDMSVEQQQAGEAASEVSIDEQRQPPTPPTGTPPTVTGQAAPGPQVPPQIDIPLGQETRLDKLRRRFVNKMRRLSYVEEKIESDTGKMIPRSERPTEKAALFEGRADARISNLERDHEDKIIKLMIDEDITENEADLYLLAMAAFGRNAMIAARDPNIPDGGSGLTNAKAQDILNNLLTSGRLPKLQRLGKLVDNLRREKLKTQVEYGLLSQKQADDWLANEPHYMPLKGVSLGGDMSTSGEVTPTTTPTGKGFSITAKEAKVAKGRSTLPFSPLATLMSDAKGVIVRGERNRVGQSFKNDIAEKYNSNAWQVFSAIPANMDSKEFLTVKENGKASYIRIPDPLLLRALTNGSAKDYGAINKFLGNTIGVATKTLSRLHTTLNPEFFVTNAFRDAEAAVFNILAEQDRVDGRIVGEKILKGFLKDVADPRNFKSLFKATYNQASKTPQQQKMMDLLQQAKEDGALTGWIMSETPEEQFSKIENALKKANAKGGKKAWYSTLDGLKSVKDAVENFNSIFENTTRLAVYKNALEALQQSYISSGVAPAEAERMARDEAANMARNVTVDFNRKGEAGPTFNALYAFANSTVQGNVQLLRSLGQNPLKNGLTGAQKLTIGIFALGALQAALGAAMSDDDDDGKSFYDKIPKYEKDRNMIFMSPDGKNYIKIPLPYGYSVFHNLGANGAEMISGKKDVGEFAANMFGSLMGNFSPISTGGGSLFGVAANLVPTALKPLADLTINENFFGGSIYNEPFDKEQSLSSVARYSTPEGYKAVAEWLNSVTGGVGKVKGKIDFSAEGIEYLVNQSIGGAGKVAFDLVDLGTKGATGKEVEVRDVPILRKVLGEPNKFADLGDYYDRVPKISTVEAQLKDSKSVERQALRKKFPVETDPAVMAAKRQAESRMREITKRKKLIMSRSGDSEQQQDQMDRLNELQGKVYTRFNTVYNRVEKEERGR